ncbi:MAG: hypothetical protein H7248_10425 [Microbacteriaceae bacterium]|nr:hypothetical protein [Microbacteriaceae bacterium]
MRGPVVLPKVTVLPLTVSVPFELVNVLWLVWSPKSAPVPDVPRVVNACAWPVDSVTEVGEIVIVGEFTCIEAVTEAEPLRAVIVRIPA